MNLSKPTFLGFSSFSKNYSLSDKDLIIRDLNNHFETIMGECDWDPSFGARFKEMIFEPQTFSNKNMIQNEIIRIIGTEPRLEINSIDVEEYDNEYIINCSLSYLGKENFNISLNLNKS